jgi:hypothetical protein
MNNKIWCVLVILAIFSVGLIGCQPSNITGLTFPQTTQTTAKVGGTPPLTSSWISPAKVSVTNFHDGATAEYPVSIHNGNNVPTMFSVYYRIPDYPRADYALATIQQQSWVLVAEQTPILAPYETRDVTITLTMPDKALAPAPHWEFWIGVMDKTQTGMVKTELCSRWEINMR